MPYLHAFGHQSGDQQSHLPILVRALDTTTITIVDLPKPTPQIPMAATTPTLALRKLIQTKLNPDDDGSSFEDSASSYEDDLRNPIKRRLASWLMPNQSRRGSTVSAVQVRNSDEWLPSTSPPVHLTGQTPSIVSLHHPPPHASSDGADPRMESLEPLEGGRAANDGTLPTIPSEVPTTWFSAHQDYDLDVDNTYQQDSLPENPVPLTSTNTRRPLVRMPSFSSTFSSSSLDSDYHHQHSHPHQSINQDIVQDTTDSTDAREDAQSSQNQSEMSMTFLYTPSPSPLPITPDMLFMSAGDQTPNMNPKKGSKDWSDGARQLMLETEQAFASDSVFDSTSFELRLPSLLEPKTQLPTEEEADTTICAEDEDEDEDEEPENAQQGDKDVDDAVKDTRSSPSSSRPGTATETKAAAEATTSTPAPAPVQPIDAAPKPPSSAGSDGSAPTSQAPRSAWVPQDTPATARRSTEQQDEMEARRSRQYENVLQSEKRKSRSVPPPLPPRDKLLAPAAQNAVPPATPSPKSTSFNTTPAVTASPPSKRAAIPKPLQHFNQARSQSKFEHGGRRPSRITRWAFGDSSVAEILTGQRFKKIEADEMLTPQQLAKLKKQREEIRRKEEFESSRAAEHKRLAEMERQVEKSSSESERSRSRSPSNRDSSASLPIHISVPEKSPRRLSGQRFKDIGGDEDEDLMDGLATVDLLNSSARTSSIPPRSPIPAGPLSPPPTAELPQVPRHSVRKSKTPRKRRTPTNSLKPEEDDECFYLKSTPYSLTSPTFRHGHISFLKSEMGRGAITMDDTLDWTAFQMAILGAGDMMPEVYDDEDPRFNEEVFRWFDSFGFESYGSLVPEMAPSPRSSSHSTVSTAPTELSIPAPTTSESPNLWPGMEGEMYDTTKFFSTNGRSAWTMNGSSLESTNHARSNSGAYDPMMPIVLTPEDGYEDGLIPLDRQDDGKGEGCDNGVEMGCNMNSDLDDFLKWEAQHAFGPGYYGAH